MIPIYTIKNAFTPRIQSWTVCLLYSLHLLMKYSVILREYAIKYASSIKSTTIA